MVVTKYDDSTRKTLDNIDLCTSSFWSVQTPYLNRIIRRYTSKSRGVFLHNAPTDKMNDGGTVARCASDLHVHHFI